MNVTTYQKQYNDNRLDNTTPTGADRPVIACSAPLNSRGDGEYFTIRMAHQAYNGFAAVVASGRTDAQDTSLGTSLKYILKIGFPSNTTFGTTGSGGATAAIEWSFDPSGTMGVAQTRDSYHTHYDADQREIPLTVGGLNAGLFHDFDFKLDYTNNKFKVFHNGTEVTATNTTAGAYSSGYTLKNDTSTSAAFLPKNMTGWELFGTTTNATASEGAIIHTMIDRAALCIPLTNPPDGAKLPPPVSDWGCNFTVNASSVGSITVLDDDSEYNLTAFFLDDEVVDWKLLMFSENIDRPLWQGVIDSVKIHQTGKSNTRELKIQARDSLGLMDKQMTSWEIGQVGVGDNDVVLSRRSEVNRLANSLNLGAAHLEEGSNLLGFSKTGYTQVHNQRTSIHSAHPIQMYNNEDEYGPNSVENEWLGYKVIAVNADVGGAVQYVFDGNPGFSASDNVNAFGFGDHDLEAAIPVSGVGSFDGKTAIKITGSSYQRETSAVLRQTKNESPDGLAVTDGGWFRFTSQPYRGTDTTDTLEVGDYITIPQTGGSVPNSGSLHIVIATKSQGGFFWAKTDSSLTNGR